jgi:hypothetical protein
MNCLKLGLRERGQEETECHPEQGVRGRDRDHEPDRPLDVQIEQTKRNN